MKGLLETPHWLQHGIEAWSFSAGNWKYTGSIQAQRFTPAFPDLHPPTATHEGQYAKSNCGWKIFWVCMEMANPETILPSQSGKTSTGNAGRDVPMLPYLTTDLSCHSLLFQRGGSFGSVVRRISASSEGPLSLWLSSQSKTSFPVKSFHWPRSRTRISRQ